VLSQEQVNAAFEECGLVQLLPDIGERLAVMQVAIFEANLNADADSDEVQDSEEEGDQPQEQHPSRPGCRKLADGSMPEEVLQRVLQFCSWQAVCNVEGVCRGSRLNFPSRDAVLWTRLAKQEALPSHDLFESSDPKNAFLMTKKSACVECGTPTLYRFTLMNCRLCEACERSHSRYSLVSAPSVELQYGLEVKRLKHVPYLDGPRGYDRLYLRSDIDAVCEKLGAQKRSPNAKGCKRQGGGRTKKSAHVARAKAATPIGNRDPCCFEVSGLELA